MKTKPNKVERGVTILDGRGGAKYPWKTLKVGQSFPVAKEDTTNVRSSGIQYAKRNNPAMVIAVAKDAKGNYHCKRLADRAFGRNA
jgi:hypothetical protein